MENVYLIPEIFEDLFIKKIEKLQRLSEKLNCNPIEINVIGEEIVKKDNKLKVYKKYQVVGDSPKLNGWILLGKVERLKELNLIVEYYKDEQIPDRYRKSSMYCEHCESNRRRKYTYILKNEETGVYKQVGKSCLKDFTGHVNPEAYADYFSFFLDLFDTVKEYQEMYEERFVCGYDEIFYDLHSVLICSSFYTLKEGYVSSNQCGLRVNLSTKELVFNLLKRGLNNIGSLKEYEEVALKTKEWMLTKENSDNSYYRNLYTFACEGRVKYKHFGYVVSAVNAMYKENEKNIKEEEELRLKKLTSNEYLGEVGEKILLDVTYVKSFHYDTQYGTTFIHQFKDKLGNTLIWKTGKYLHLIEANEIVQLKGKVKAHEEYFGVNQTLVKNCKVEKVM